MKKWKYAYAISMLSVSVWIPQFDFWMPELIFMKLGIYIMAPECFSTAYFINSSHQSVRLYMCISYFIARQRLRKHVPSPVNKSSHRIIVGRVCMWVRQYIRLSLLVNKSLKVFAQGRIVGDVVFYPVRIVSKEISILIIPRTSCFYCECSPAWSAASNYVKAVHCPIHQKVSEWIGPPPQQKS
jgi:hypothetical protein